MMISDSLTRFFLVVLMVGFFAMTQESVRAGEVVRHQLGAWGSHEKCLLVTTPYYTLAIDTLTGEIVNLQYEGWSHNVLGSPLPVLGWDSLIEGGAGRFPKKEGAMRIETDTPEKLVVCFSLQGDSPSTANLVLEKRYEIHLTSPVIQSKIDIHNSGPTQRLHYRMYHGLRPATDTHELYTLYPRPTGVIRYDGQKFPYPDKRELAEVTDFTDAWVATMNASKQGVILQTDFDQITQLRNIQHYPSVEFTWREVALRRDATFSTFFNIIPVNGLEGCDFVSSQLVIDVQPSQLVHMDVMGLATQKNVSINVRCVRQDGQLVKAMGKRSIDLVTNQVSNVSFGDPLLPPGAYGLQVEVTGGDGQTIGKFAVPYAVGRVDEPYRVALAQPTVAKGATSSMQMITPVTYKKLRQARDTTNTLVVRRWSYNTSYHVEEALKQLPNTQVKVIHYHGSARQFQARDFPLDPEDFMQLDAIYLVDAPASMFSKLDLINLRDYVKAGGMLVVFNGAISANTYRGSALEQLLPLQFDDDDPKLNWARAAFALDPTPTLPTRRGPDASPLLDGVGGDLPQSTAYPATLKSDGKLLLSAWGKYDKQTGPDKQLPLVAVRREGLGSVVSFAIRPDRRGLSDPLTTWGYFPQLLGRMLDANMDRPLSAYSLLEPVAVEREIRLEPAILEHDFNYRLNARARHQALNEWAMGRGDVFTWGSTVPLPVTVKVTQPVTLRYELSITDQRGNVIHTFSPRTQMVRNTHEFKDQWQAPALARGAYIVKGLLYKDNVLVDEFKETLYCEPESDWRDYYPINFSYFGYGGRDTTTIERGVEEVDILKKMGFNTIGYGYFADEILKAGLYHSTVSNVKNLVWNNQTDFRDPIEEKKLRAAVERNYKEYARRPRMGVVQTDDETHLPKRHGLGKIDKAIFREQYGYEMPVDEQDPNWYQAATFRSEGMAQAMRKARVIMRDAAPSIGMTRDRAICFASVYHHSIHPTWDAFHEGPGAPRYVLAERWAASDPAIIDHTLAWTWAATDFSDHRLGLIMGIIPEAGQDWKSALGFWLGISHGAEFLEGYTWVSTHGYLVDSPQRVDVLTRTLNSISQVAPLFLHTKKQRARIAMLCPWKTSMSLDPATQAKNWPEDYVTLRQAFGQVDVLYDQQLEAQLPNIDMLIIPRGALSIHSDTQARLKAWAARGGLLVAAPNTASLNEKRQPTQTLNDTSLVHRVDLASTNTISQLHTIAGGRIKLLAQSDNKKIVCNLHVKVTGESSNSRILTAVNLDRESQATTIKAVLDDVAYQARDMLTGQNIPVTQNGREISVNLNIPGAWGTVILLTPTPPTTLAVEAKTDGEKLTYDIQLTGDNNVPLDYPAVCTIAAIDPQGNEHIEYGGTLVANNGKLSRTLPLPINEIPGRWTLIVTEGASNSKAQTTFTIGDK